jgi:hypothetical protein
MLADSQQFAHTNAFPCSTGLSPDSSQLSNSNAIQNTETHRQSPAQFRDSASLIESNVISSTKTVYPSAAMLLQSAMLADSQHFAHTNAFPCSTGLSPDSSLLPASAAFLHTEGFARSLHHFIESVRPHFSILFPGSGTRRSAPLSESEGISASAPAFSSTAFGESEAMITSPGRPSSADARPSVLAIT